MHLAKKLWHKWWIFNTSGRETRKTTQSLSKSKRVTSACGMWTGWVMWWQWAGQVSVQPNRVWHWYPTRSQGRTDSCVCSHSNQQAVETYLWWIMQLHCVDNVVWKPKAMAHYNLPLCVCGRSGIKRGKRSFLWLLSAYSLLHSAVLMRAWLVLDCFRTISDTGELSYECSFI